MPPVVLTTAVLELTTGLYTFEVIDEHEEAVDAGQLTTMVLTYYDLVSGAMINNRDSQDVLNTNAVTILTVVGPPKVTTVTWVLQPEDTVLVDARRELEQHVALFQWTWDSGSRASAHEVQFPIEQITYVV